MHFQKFTASMQERNCHISNVILFYGKFFHISSIHLYSLVKFTSISFRVKLTDKIPFFTDIEFSQSCCTGNSANKLRLLKASKRTSKLKKTLEWGLAREIQLYYHGCCCPPITTYSNRKDDYYLHIHSQYTTSKWFCRLLFG